MAHHHDGHTHHSHGANRHLLIGLALTAGFAVVEFAGGWLAGSLALIGDAGHMITDAAALGLGAFAAWLARRPPSHRHSFGLQRAEVIGALVNAMFMLGVVAWIGIEAVDRLIEPAPVAGGVVLAIAVVGLALNLLVLRVLHGGGHDLNTRAAVLHVMGDLLGSVAAVTSGLVITLTGWTPIDPMLSLLICALILVSTGRLLREAVHVVMEGVPGHLDLARVGQRLASIPGVHEVHDLHVWSLASDSHALAAHVRLDSLVHWPEQLARARQLMASEFHIDHITLQPELNYRIDVVAAPRPRVRRERE